MRNLDPKRARWIRMRMGALLGLMGLGLGALVATAFRVQVEDGSAWREVAERQRQRRLHIEPKRGTLLDRNGTTLAVSVEVPSASIDVVELLRGVEKPEAQDELLRDASQRLSQILSLPIDDVRTKLNAKRRFAWLKRRITGEETAALKALGDVRREKRPLRGIAIEGEGQRYYPGRELAGPLLGFVAPDGLGKDGLELSLDEDLRGRVEEVNGLRDRSGRLIFSNGSAQPEAFAGHDVQLAIDAGLQRFAEKELDGAFGTYELRSASLVVMEPNSGEILAMASVPGYNPNDYGQSETEARRDRAIADRFEPGSVMKAFTLAGALASGTLKATEQIFCENGNYKLGPVVIHDTHQNGWMTPTQILAKSSNIGTLKIGLSLGEAGLYGTFRKFGFAEPTGVPLPGEAAGVLRPRGRPWFEVETANASFGQGVSVTTLQLATAFAALANGGRLLEPILVKKITNARGEVVRDGLPRVRREVVPPGVARTVADMLTAVTEPGGTGVEAAVPGFRVAGKTATAQKIDPLTGKYSNEKYTSSFVGFVPAERPRVVVAVVLDEPIIGHYGGDLAGPVFRRVAEAALRTLGVHAPAPSRTLAVSREGDPADQARAIFAKARPVEAEVPPVTMTDGAVRVPDLAGMPAREAVRALTAAGFVPQVEGFGRLIKQTPAGGAPAQKGSPVRLLFEPAS
ncbi:MAG: PASTA domain-containing protein [Myxococcales bacterium]|nr:PASTA domain-containing protein [Myxococcales bacterium]